MNPRIRARNRLLGLVAGLLVLGYAGAVGYLKFNERDIIFRPSEREVAMADALLALREQRVSYPAPDGVTLSAWIVPAATGGPGGPWLLICHGNFGNIGYGKRQEFYAYMRDVGINLFAFDYRGYGLSTGSPDERGVYSTQPPPTNT